VPKNAPDNISLTLGFEDDDYGGNGYWGHDRDNGPNGQCPTPGTQYAELGKPAWVTIVISTTGTTTPNKAMDLVSDTVDPNDLPLNPWWAYEKGVDHLPGDPQGPPDPDRQCGLRYIDPDNVDLGINLSGGHCTTQSPSVNQGTGLNGELCRHAAEDGVLAGHLNWFVSTYTGKIKWDDWSGTFSPLHPTKSGDDDYNFFFLPDSGTGLTAARPESIGLEFDSDETVDRIDKGWWNDFHDQVKNNGGPDGAAAKSILNAPAIAIGLMGLDSEHGAYSELHPVYGLAIHIKSDAGHVGTDDWVFLARNYGNEGYCADGNMTVPQLTTLSFFIPRDNAIGEDPASPTLLNELYSTSDNNSVALSFVTGGAIISFNVGSPQDQTLYSGHVQFHWQLSGAAGRAASGIKNENIGELRIPAVAGKSPGPGGHAIHLPAGPIRANPVVIAADASELSAKVLGGFPPSVLPAVNALLAKKAATAHAVQVRRVAASPRPRIHKARPSYIRATKVPDPAREARESQLLKLYCDTYPGGKSPYLTVRSCSRLTTRPREVPFKP
jgi:hypothetical protein